jgi:hypothetical protein
MNLTATEIVTFVPAQDRYLETIEFYKEVGFTVDFTNDSVTALRWGSSRFFLQNYNWPGADGNFMMGMRVEDLDAWWHHLDGLDLPSKYPGVRLRAPENYPWGMREIHLSDPTGVLWHIGVPIA